MTVPGEDDWGQQPRRETVEWMMKKMSKKIFWISGNYLFFVYLVYFIDVEPNPWQVAYHLNKHYTVQKHRHGYFGSENKFRFDFFVCCFEFIHCLEGGTIFEEELPHQVFVLYS